MGVYSADQAAPARNWRAVTPSDTVPLPAGCRGIYVGGAGNVVAAGDDGVNGTFTGVLAGTTLPIGPRFIRAATTATLLLALY